MQFIVAPAAAEGGGCRGWRDGGGRFWLPCHGMCGGGQHPGRRACHNGPMRVAYLDCFAGISGDMFLGALLDAGVELAVLERATAAMGLGASLRVRTVDRSGISATKVDVIRDGRLAEESGRDEQVTHAHQHQAKAQHLHRGGHDHDHETEAGLRGGQAPGGAALPGLEPGHTHEPGHTQPHEHGHTHEHGRSLTEIRRLIGESSLAEAVKARATRTFELLGQSEAKIHNVPVDDIHFHEVGAVDAIVDLVAASAGIEALNEAARRETGEALAWHCSPLNVGGGMVECAHGTFPVPAPATADLLRGMPTYSAHVQQELVTPTGAALVRALAPEFGQQPAMRVERIGYGAGGRDPKGFPNVLRLLIGETGETAGTAVMAATDLAGGTVTGSSAGTGASGAGQARRFGGERTPVVVLETALDDSSPQVLAHVMEQALAKGALDAMSTAVGMKKGRQGTLLTLLCAPADADALELLLLRETSTLGVRRREEQRSCLGRSHVTVETALGPIRVKVGELRGETLNAQPEFDDCRMAAAQHGVPVKRVMQGAMVAYAGLAKGEA